MLFYVFLIATLNLGVGFAVAKSLGRGPRMPSRESILEWARYLGWWSFDRLIHLQLPKRFTRKKPASQPAAATVAAPKKSPPRPTAQPQAPTVEHADEEPVEEESPDAETEKPEDAVPSVVDEVSVEDMMAGLMQFRNQVASLDTKVRRCSRKPETREVKQCVDEFKQANGEFLAKSEEISEQLAGKASTDKNDDELRTKVQEAVQEQVAEVRRASQTLDHIDVDGDPKAGCQAMLSQSQGLIASSSQLSDKLTEARIEVAKQSGSPVECESLLIDELTQLPSRIALDKKIESLTTMQATPSITLALIDIDRLGDLNHKFGAQLGDRLLQGVSKHLNEQLSASRSLSRFEGQRFALLAPGESAKEISVEVEQLRQQLEATSFRAAEESISVTVSCSVADLQPEEELADFYTRIGSALNEAKRFGRNRTFLHDGKSPAPVVPPETEIDARVIDI